jgi:hypothetical protein
MSEGVNHRSEATLIKNVTRNWRQVDFLWQVGKKPLL